MTPKRKKLPIGISTFADIRTGNYCYVDKTRLIHRLVEDGRFYFLSRPRRFGKSLLIDTIAEAFAGSKDLFTGLYLEEHWDWEQKFPVVRIDFAESIITSRERLDGKIRKQLDDCAHEYEIALRYQEISDCFSELIRELHRKIGQQVVVLVDEYDKPILDNITDQERATELRDGLRNFYSVLKAQGAHLRFVMLTGVSKFSKVSIFSGLNNLKDITLDRRFGTICGYTQDDLETIFHEYLEGVDLSELKEWYNGYNFLNDPVYNPFDVLLYLDSKEFKSYWFETGTPSFLIKLLQQNRTFIPELEDMTVGEELLGSFDVDFIEPETLLFQTGYLTIIKKEHLFDEEYVYRLGFPNHEVRKSLTGSILHWYIHSQRPVKNNQMSLLRALQSNNLDDVGLIFAAFFDSIPNEWYRKNDIADYEGYYCSVVYCYFAALGLDVRPEESNNHGKIDMVVRFENKVYVIEFKVNELTDDGRALAQIKEKGYHQKFTGQETYLIGVEFSKNERNVSRFEWERVDWRN